MALINHSDGGYDLEEGYRLEKVIGGPTYPSNIEFGPDGELYVAEAGFTYPFIYSQARISRLNGDDRELIAEGPPVVTGCSAPYCATNASPANPLWTITRQ